MRLKRLKSSEYSFCTLLSGADLWSDDPVWQYFNLGRRSIASRFELCGRLYLETEL